MALQDEIERAAARAAARREIEQALATFPPAERRSLLLDIFVADVSRAQQGPDADPEVVSLRPTSVESALGVFKRVVPHGSRADETVNFLQTCGGATVEQVARAIYGGDDPDSRKKAASMLSLLRSGNGGSRVFKDEETDVWMAFPPKSTEPKSDW